MEKCFACLMLQGLELGSVNYGGNARTNGDQSVAIAIAQTAGSNAQEVIEGSLKVLDDSSLSFPKGVKYASLVNANDFLSESIYQSDCNFTCAFLLVFIVVFVFL